MLTTDLDGDDEKDKGALDNLLSQLIAELCMDKKVSCAMSTCASICSFWTRLLPMEELIGVTETHYCMDVSRHFICLGSLHMKYKTKCVALTVSWF